MFSPCKLCLIDLTALILRGVHTQLLECEHVGAGCHCSAGHDNGRNINAGKSDQIAGHSLVTARNVDTCVKRRRIGLNLDHIGYHLAAAERVIDTVVTLALAVAHIGRKIACAVSALLADSFACRLHEFVQVTGARVTVTECALDKYLDFSEIFRFPAGTDAKGIELGCICAEYLAWHFLNILHNILHINSVGH